VRLDVDQIATATFIEHFVVTTALEKNCTLKEASREVCGRFGITESLIFPTKQTQILNLAYGLLVFPSEIWRRKGLLEVVVERMRSDPELLNRNKEIATSKAIKCIRNSLSHARIDFSEQLVRFSDQRGDNPAHFCLELSYRETLNFLLVLGRAFHESAQVSNTLAKTWGRK
jgi:hypothetical protein